MNRFIFKGDDTNLGRFGAVRKGDILVLADDEAAGIKGDKRFEHVKDGAKTVPKPGQFVTITDKMTPEEKAAAEKANHAEKERLLTLAKENDADRVEILEIKSKTFDELAAMAARINEEAKGTVIDIGKRTSRPELMRQILNHRRNLKGGDALAEETVEEEEDGAPPANPIPPAK